MTHTFLERSELVPVLVTCIVKEKTKKETTERVLEITSNMSMILKDDLFHKSFNWIFKFSANSQLKLRISWEVLGDLKEQVSCKNYLLNLYCFFRLIRDSMSSYKLRSVTKSLFHDDLSRLFGLLWNTPWLFLDHSRS